MQEKIRGHLVQRIGGGAGDRSQRAAGEFAWHQATYVRCRDGLSILGQEDFVPNAPYTHLLSPGMIGAIRLRNPLLVTAMGVRFSTTDGSWGPRRRAFLERPARGGP